MLVLIALIIVALFIIIPKFGVLVGLALVVLLAAVIGGIRRR